MNSIDRRQICRSVPSFRGFFTAFHSAVFFLVFLTIFLSGAVCVSGSFGAAASADTGGEIVLSGGISVFVVDGTADLSGLTREEAEQAAMQLKAVPDLKRIVLSKQDTEGNETFSALSPEEFRTISEAVPDAEYDYCFELAGAMVSTSSTEELEFKKRTDFTDAELEQLRIVMPYMRELKSITVYRCGTSDEAMDAFRADFPEVKVRWVIRFAAFSAWSDTEKIWAMAGLYDDADAVNLKYFHDLKYLDLGHNGLKTCEFLYGTPNVEVLILAVGNMTDITPVSSLQHLEYLEICDSLVTDLSPLSSCTTLEHLNLGGIPATDLSPLYSLTNLKRLFADNMSYISDYDRAVYEETFRELLPEAEISFEMWPGGGTENGYWRYSRGPYTGSFVPRYQLLREQFGYEDNDQAYVYDY